MNWNTEYTSINNVTVFQRDLESEGLTVYLMEYFDVDFDEDDQGIWEKTRNELMDRYAKKSRGKSTNLWILKR